MTSGEKNLCNYEFGHSGSFMNALFDAFFRADEENVFRLSLGFPGEAEAVQRYQNEDGYWDRLRTEYVSNEKGSE